MCEVFYSEEKYKEFKMKLKDFSGKLKENNNNTSIQKRQKVGFDKYGTTRKIDKFSYVAAIWN